MAALVRLSGALFAVDYVHGGKRNRLRLGRVGRPVAESVRRRLSAIEQARKFNTTLEPELQDWLRGLADDEYAKLAATGFVPPRESTGTGLRLSEWLNKLVVQKTPEWSAATLALYTLTGRKLREWFPDDPVLADISASRLADWRASMVAAQLAEGTVNSYVRHARAVFGEAVRRDIIFKNPCRGLPCASVAADKGAFITPDEARRVLAEIELPWLRVAFVLARWAGLRTPSEANALTWADCDWERNRITIRSPKTGERVSPMDPMVRDELSRAFTAAPVGAVRVACVPRNNTHPALKRAIKAAGLAPWPDLWKALRRARETEWRATFPPHVVGAWIGHSAQVGDRHYAQVREEDFVRAARG